MQRKIVTGFALLVPLAIAGCTTYLPDQEPPPYKDVKLTVACPAGLEELVRVRSRPWAERQQAQVIPEQARPNALGTADVRLIAPAELPRWASGEAVAKLPESLTRDGGKFEWRGLLPEYRERLLLWDRSAFAVPITGEAPVCVYRADLFGNPDVQKGYRAWQEERNKQRAAQKLPPLDVRDLRAPPTWDEFASQAEFFCARDKKPSLPPLPAGDAALDRLFFSVAASYARRAVPADEKEGKEHLDETFSFQFDQQTGAPRISEAGFVEALKLLQRLQKCRPAGASERPEASFIQGEAVLCLTDAPSLVAFQKSSKLRDRFGVCQIPGAERYRASGQWRYLKDTTNRVPYLGGAGWLAVVPRSSKNQEAAFDLLEELAGPAGSRQTALEPRWGGPTRAEHLYRDRWDAYDLDPARTASLKEALSRTLLQHNVKNPAICLRTPAQADYRAALIDTGLRPALLEGKGAGESLTEVKKLWEAMIAKGGKEERLRDYRISMGLLGR